MGLEEKEISRRMIHKGRIINLREDTVELPSGKKAKREIVEHRGAVAIIAITKDNELILIRQFRKAAEQVLIEVPAGIPEKSEKGEDAARRELEEETGFHAKKIRKIWEGYVSPGYSDELIEFYLAQDMAHTGQKTEEDEFIEPTLIDIDACVDLVKSGKIKDNKTAIGIMLADMVIKSEL